MISIYHAKYSENTKQLYNIRKYYRVKKNMGNRKGTLFKDKGAPVLRTAILDVYVLNNIKKKTEALRSQPSQ